MFKNLYHKYGKLAIEQYIMVNVDPNFTQKFSQWLTHLMQSLQPDFPFFIRHFPSHFLLSAMHSAITVPHFKAQVAHLPGLNISSPERKALYCLILNKIELTNLQAYSKVDTMTPSRPFIATCVFGGQKGKLRGKLIEPFDILFEPSDPLNQLIPWTIWSLA